MTAPSPTQVKQSAQPVEPDGGQSRINSVLESEYDEAWIKETWGWDDAETFIKSGGTNLRPRISKALEYAGVSPGMRVLDVGCGRGEVVLECARRGAEAVGFDFSAAAISVGEQARNNCPAAVREHSRFIRGDVKDFAKDIGLFDLIFLLDVVEHLHDWELVPLLTSLRHLLADGGKLVIHTLPNRWVYEFTYRRIVRLFMPWLRKNPRSEKEMAIHVNEMSVTHLDQLLRRCGFSCSVWLSEMVTHQALWHARAPLGGKRGRLYRLMSNPVAAWLYRGAALTPLRFLIVNDIFAIAWREDEAVPVPLSGGWLDRLICWGGGRWFPWKFSG